MKEKIKREDLANKFIDIHTHATGINYTNYYLEAFPYCCNICDLVTNMKLNNVDYSVTFPIPTNINTKNSPEIDKEIRKTIEKYENHPYFYENKRLLQEVEIFGENKILPFVMISLYSKIEEQIESYLELKEEYPIYGFKINPSTDGTNVKTILNNKVLKNFFEKEKLPIILHCSTDEYSRGDYIFDVVKELKTVRFCIAHAARLNEKVFNELNNINNLWIDCSPLIKLFEVLKKQNSEFFIKNKINSCTEFIEFLYNNFENKTLFGTDYPWSYCGYLESNINNNLSNIYEDNIKILKKTPGAIKNKIANKNCINYLYGKEY